MSEEFRRYSVANIGIGDQICSLCQKTLSSDSDATGDLDNISICGDCKFLFLEDLDAPSREPRRRRPPSRRRRARHSSVESAEDLFSQQFSHMINLVRQSQPATLSGLENPPPEPPESEPAARLTSGGSGRWRRVFSDTESDEPERPFHGEIDAVSFTTYGADSDASVDLNGFLDPTNDDDDDSDFGTDTDTDIDPMHAGLSHWNSEEDGEAEEEWEEVEEEQPGRNFAEEPPVWAAEFGDPRDYFDSGGLEEFLRHLAAEDEGSRRGAPPASASFVGGLPRVVVDEERDRRDGGIICAICKEALPAGAVANRLPCDHLYHPPCIFPWLSSRNSCPLCRYELPTDDKDYENGKRHRRRHHRGAGVDRQAAAAAEADEDGGSVTLSDGEEGEEVGRTEEADGSAGEGGRGRWLFLAAAPIVGLVGIVLVLWLGNLGAEGRGGESTRGADVAQRHVRVAASSGGQRESRSRRWWSFF